MNGAQQAQKLYDTSELAPSERTIHKQVIEWARMQENAIPELKALFHPPNGGDRHPAVAAKLKKMGAKAGVPDLCLPIAAEMQDGTRYGALWIELKSQSGRMRETQETWRDRLQRHGHAWALCRSFDDAKTCIMDYLDGSFDPELYTD